VPASLSDEHKGTEANRVERRQFYTRIAETSLASKGLEAGAVSAITRRLLPFLFLLYIVAYLDRMNVGFAALQMQKQLGFNDLVYGRAAGTFFLGYFLFQVPSNLILERLGARRWIVILMVSWGIISSSLIFVTTPRSFYILRFCLGLAEAGFFPGIVLYLKNWFPIEARARALAWFMTAQPVSGVIGGPVSGALLVLHGHRGLAGWQWLFLLEGLPAILLGMVSAFFLSDTPERARWLTDEHRSWLVATLTRQQPQFGERRRQQLFSVFTSGNVWLLALTYFGLNTGGYGVTLWLPSLIHSLSGISSFAIGMLSAIPYVLAAVIMVLVGIHSDRTGERRLHAALFAFLAAVALPVAASSQSIGPMIAALSIAVLSGYCLTGPFWALSTSLLSGTGAAAGIAVINAIGNLGGFCGPYILGSVRASTGNFKGGLLILSAVMALSGCLLLLARSGEAPHELNPPEKD
jgi:ACS family tartrate transporter-like MFS transporter